MPFGYRPNGYTEADQRSDTSFLVGVRYGESVQRQIVVKKLNNILTAWNDDTIFDVGILEIHNLIKELTGE